MIVYLHGYQMGDFPTLAHKMFRDRAERFTGIPRSGERLNSRREERDEFDSLNPLYVISVDEYGNHRGSMRLMPTVGNTKLNKQFGQNLGCKPIKEQNVWEVSKVCISMPAKRSVATQLVAGSLFVMKHLDLQNLVTVVDESLANLFSRVGCSSEALFSWSDRGQELSLESIRFDDTLYEHFLRKTSLTELALKSQFYQTQRFRTSFASDAVS